MKTLLLVVCLVYSGIGFAVDYIQVPTGGGKFYNAQGRLEIRVDSSGKMYDSGGKYQGKFVDGKMYDKNNRLKGTWR